MTFCYLHSVCCLWWWVRLFRFIPREQGHKHSAQSWKRAIKYRISKDLLKNLITSRNHLKLSFIDVVLVMSYLSSAPSASQPASQPESTNPQGGRAKKESNIRDNQNAKNIVAKGLCRILWRSCLCPLIHKLFLLKPKQWTKSCISPFENLHRPLCTIRHI